MASYVRRVDWPARLDGGRGLVEAEPGSQLRNEDSIVAARPPERQLVRLAGG
jgi:hypothetical protein